MVMCVFKEKLKPAVAASSMETDVLVVVSAAKTENYITYVL